MSSESYWRVKKKFYANSMQRKGKKFKSIKIGDFMMKLCKH